MTEKYLLLSLDDEKSKSLAEVLGNDSCKKIINFLAEKNATGSEIAKELKMPLNSVVYNISKLLKSGFVEQESHWWSVKGKKIPIYKLSNKQILISPKKSSMSKIKTIIPVALVSGIVALGIKYYFAKNLVTNISYEATAPSMESLKALPSFASNSLTLSSWINYDWLWFLAGCLFAITLFLILNWRRIK